MNKTKKLVCGIGVNDSDYAVTKYVTIEIDGKQKQKLVWKCNCYSVWVDMLNRCYSNKLQERRHTYTGCTVTDEWLTFSNFKVWMEKQDYEGKQLDKDILFEGNKIYSENTCVFVSPMVNTFVIDCSASRGEYLVGVNWHKAAKKFVTQCSNPFTKKREHLGLFTSELEAHEAWKKRKLELAKELAAIQTDPRVAKALIERYTNYDK